MGGRSGGYEDELGYRVGGFGGTGMSRPKAEEAIKSQAGPTRGLKLGGPKGGTNTNKFLASLAAEGEDVAMSMESLAAKPQTRRRRATVAQDGVSLKIEEKLNVTLKKDGGIEGMEVQGTMMLEIRGGEEDAFIRVGVATGANEDVPVQDSPQHRQAAARRAGHPRPQGSQPPPSRWAPRSASSSGGTRPATRAR